MIKTQFQSFLERDESTFNMIVHGVGFLVIALSFKSCLSPGFLFPRPHITSSAHHMWELLALPDPQRRWWAPFLMFSRSHSTSLVISFSSLTSPYLLSLLFCIHPAPFSLSSHPSVNSTSPVFPLLSHASWDVHLLVVNRFQFVKFA